MDFHRFLLDYISKVYFSCFDQIYAEDYFLWKPLNLHFRLAN